MTDRLSTLTRLRDMVRNADGPDQELACRLNAAFHGHDFAGDIFIGCGDAGESEFCYSCDDGETEYVSELWALDRRLDAVYGLADHRFTGCKISLSDVGQRHAAHIKWDGLEASAYGNTRPLAILDCLLSILIEKEGRDGRDA